MILKKIIAISKYFFRKNIRDIISFSIILFGATILFSSAIIINCDISKNYNREFDRLNTANSFFVIPSSQYSNHLLEEIKDREEITDIEVQKGVMLSVSVDMDGSVQEQNQIFHNIDDNPNINKREIIKRINNSKEFGIYLSNYTFIHSKGIRDVYEFNIDDTTYTFNIKGVVNEMQYGNYSSSVIGEYLESDSYNYLLQNNKDKEIIVISVRSEDGYLSYKNISRYLSNNNIDILNQNYDEQAKNQRLAISNILVLVLMVFASSMLIISLFVSKFKIGQTIEEEMTNMGALEALGYTSKEIIIANIFPYIISGLIFTLFGIVTSYFILPLLGKVIELQSGFIWRVKLYLDFNIFVLFINLILITIFTFMASVRIKKLNPINAIRQIYEGENKKSCFEIERTNGNIHFILMLKNFMGTKKQNILLGIVLFFITMISSFIGILFYNINMNPLHFINTLVEEHPSVIVSSNKDLRDELRNEKNVKNVIYYDENPTVNYNDNSYKTFVAEDFGVLANNLCYEGSNPQTGTEVAVGSKIQETYNINIGDYIILSKNGVENKYKVVGFIQSVNYSGEVVEMTIDGYQNLDNSYLPTTMYVYLEKEEGANEFIHQVKDTYGHDILFTMNYAESMDSAMNMYVSLIGITCIIIIIVALFLIYLILYILISSIITKRKQELGVLKALGYEHKQLVKQLIGGFLPCIVIGTLLGFTVSKIFMASMYNVIFQSVGAYKVSFEYPFVVFLLIVFLVVLGTVIIGIILANKIRKISVYSLIRD